MSRHIMTRHGKIALGQWVVSENLVGDDVVGMLVSARGETCRVATSLDREREVPTSTIRPLRADEAGHGAVALTGDGVCLAYGDGDERVWMGVDGSISADEEIDGARIIVEGEDR